MEVEILILTVVTVDVMAWVLLQPWLTALRDAGYEVHIACSDSGYVEKLRGAGFTVHVVGLSRSFNPFRNVRALFQIMKLIRNGGYVSVNTHSPVAAAVGRVAAAICGFRPVVYVVHGFYFHDNMRWLARKVVAGIERILGRWTNAFMFVSDEDHRTALLEGIVRRGVVAETIWNGIDLNRFAPAAGESREGEELRGELGIAADAPVVGIVGRIVREKGYREFVEMAERVRARRPDAHFLVVGSTLVSDRDQFGEKLKELVKSRGLEGCFHLAGQVADCERYLRASDVFVLPSYREGFPRSVIEAMGCGLPVVATNIRGSREAVVEGETGFIVPVRDGGALAVRVLELIEDPAKARAMGAAGRKRAVELYDEKLVQRRFVDVIARTMKANGAERMQEERG